MAEDDWEKLYVKKRIAEAGSMKSTERSEAFPWAKDSRGRDARRRIAVFLHLFEGLTFLLIEHSRGP